MKKILSLVLILAMFLSSFFLTAFSIEKYYTQTNETVAPFRYRWEMVNDALVSVSTNGNTINPLTLESGSVADGRLKAARYSLESDVQLRADRPWSIEWRSMGNWSGMLLSSTATSPSEGLTYLFRDPGSRLFAFGEYTGSWNNYGLIQDCDMSVSHVFRLENRIATDGSNTVYFTIDGMEIGAMDHYYITGKDQNKTINWINGKDIVFRNIGTTSHPIQNMQLEYLEISLGNHDHTYQSVVTAPTCTQQGYTTYTCPCGSSYTLDYAAPTGHSYENGICTICKEEAPGPYAGKTIACIGDSITAGVGVTKDQTDYVTLLAKALEMDYIRLGASGSTLCTDGHAKCNIGKLTASNLKGADVVTILMGINDFVQAQNGYYDLGTIASTDTSTIYGAVHMWCQRIEELRQTESLRDTQFYFMTPVITSWNNSVSSVRNWDQAKVNIHGYRLRDLCNAIIEVCALYDIPVIDLNLLSGLYYVSASDNNIDVFGGDGAHPGVNGHQMMAKAIEKELLQPSACDSHSYGSWIITSYPDCVSGVSHRVCTVCAATESKMLDGTGHNYENSLCTLCGDREKSTFRIYDTRSGQEETFTYEIGMSWRKWLNSPYNTGMGSCIAIDVTAGPDLLGGNPYMDIHVNGHPADYDEPIQEQDTIELVKNQ